MKVINHAILLFTVIFLASSSFALAENAHAELSFLIADEKNNSPELVDLSLRLKNIKRSLFQHNGIKTIYICGSSARTILDHIYFQTPLNMRDLDVAIIAEQEIDVDFVENIAHHLVEDDLGHFVQKELGKRVRVPVDFPALPTSEYNAGYGCYIVDHEDNILDLSVFEYPSDLNLNGILDIDTIKIVLRFDQELLDFALAARSQKYSNLMELGWISDPFGGYASWLTKDFMIVHWEEVEADPFLQSIRLVRAYAKTDQLELPHEYWKGLHNLLSSTNPLKQKRLTQALLRMLDDENWAEELHYLQQLGVFRKWLPNLSKQLERMSVGEIHALRMRVPKSYYASNLEKLQLLLKIVPSEERLALIYDSLSLYDLKEALAWILDECSDEIWGPADKIQLQKLIESFSNQRKKIGCFKTQACRIVNSRVLVKQEKFQLLLRALLKDVPECERISRLKLLFPGSDRQAAEDLVKSIKPKRKGILTGVFDPVHCGHIELIKLAVEQNVLDQIVIIPVITRRANSEILSWEERKAMLQMAIRQIPEASLIEESFKHLLQKGIGEVVEKLLSENSGDTRLFHIMGTDAFERLKQYVSLESYPAHIFVVHRFGSEPSIVSDASAQSVTYFVPEKPIISNNPEGNVSSTEVRRLCRAQQPISHLVPRVIERYLEQTKRYQLKSRVAKPLYIVVSNDEDLKAAQKVIPFAQPVFLEFPQYAHPDPKQMMEGKLHYAFEKKKDRVAVLDTFIRLEAFGNLTEVLTKEMIRQMSSEQLFKLLETAGSFKLQLKVMAGYMDAKDQIVFFETTREFDLREPLLDKEFSLEELCYGSGADVLQYSLVEQTMRKLYHHLKMKD